MSDARINGFGAKLTVVMDYGRNDHSIALNIVSSNSIDLILFFHVY